jgi:uncharacterized protein (TIGR04222 family)
MVNPLMSNPIANMSGPDFLALYLLAIILSAITCYILVKLVDPSRQLPPLNLPQEIDPYEIAYLRHQEEEVVRVVVINLTQRQYLKIDAPKCIELVDSIKEASIQHNLDHPSLDLLEPLEKAVFAHCKYTQLSALANKTNPSTQQLLDEIKKLCQPYKLKLRTHQLIPGPAWNVKANQIKLFLISSLVFIASYKIILALIKGHYNVGFLIFLTLVAIPTILLSGRIGCLTYRGRNYLEELKLVCTKFKNGLPAKDSKTTSAVNSNLAPLPVVGIVDPWTVTTAVGIFGVGVLASTELNAYNTLYRVNSLSDTTTGGGCGTSCSSCSSGGGGCGGGGCGGCGGGCS